jgi:uncharacterized protein (DUF2141 family)
MRTIMILLTSICIGLMYMKRSGQVSENHHKTEQIFTLKSNGLKYNMDNEIQNDGPLLKISNIKVAKGSLKIQIFDSETTFMNPQMAVLEYSIRVQTTGTLTQKIEGLKDGTYAVTCFHDINNNGKLDTNIIGIPTEPYGFSNGVRPMFRAATWVEAKIYLNQTSEIYINIENW